jgi:hypothetical protein
MLFLEPGEIVVMIIRHRKRWRMVIPECPRCDAAHRHTVGRIEDGKPCLEGITPTCGGDPYRIKYSLYLPAGVLLVQRVDSNTRVWPQSRPDTEDEEGEESS